MMPQVRIYPLYRKGIREVVAFGRWEEGTKTIPSSLDNPEPQIAMRRRKPL